jgi:hypothetical protein
MGFCFTTFNFKKKTKPLKQMKKKLILLAVSTLSITCACDDTQEKIPTNGVTEIAVLKQMHAESLALAASQLGDFVRADQRNKTILLEQSLIVKSTLENLKGKYFMFDNLDYLKIVDSFKPFELRREELSGRINTDFSSFSQAQLDIAFPFMDQLYEIEDPSLVSDAVYNFATIVANSSLTDYEKLDLYSLGAAADETVNFIVNGGIEIVYESLSPYYGEISGRAKACSIDFKSVWRGAVIGFFSGGVTGGVAGCLGGTVVLPVIGTATGCVGGAVFGAAGGFTAGALSGIAQEVVFKCVLG